MDNDNFIGQIFLQKCGDSLQVIGISPNKDKYNRVLYIGRFLKYPCEIERYKCDIKVGKVNNPQIEVIEFMQKEWPQKCGDSLKIIEKTNLRTNNGKGNILFRCQFINYPIEILSTKGHIINGCVDNPQIEIVEFMQKEWPQNCGDTLIIIEKTQEKRSGDKEFLFRCKFIKYPCEVLASKCTIINGQIDNPNLPWRNKIFLENFIKDKYKKEKPSLIQLAKDLNISRQKLGRNLIQFNLQSYVNYWIGNQEKELRNYIKEITGQIYNSKNDKNFEIDIFVKDKNLGFEYNGNYWHCSLFKTPIYHQEKTLFFQSKGIFLIHIFEFEWLNKQTICKSLIKAKLGLFDKKIGARQCEIRELKNQEYQNFCNKNHLQGEAGARVKLGLYYKDKLIQIMSFGSPRFTLEYEWEIIRECSKLGYFIIGGKQRLWNYFVKKYHPNNCISYCDFSKFTGESYIKLGFKQLRLNKPGFWWYDEENKEVYWRNPVKHKEMVEAGYLKIYDCGQLVFSWNKV